MDRDAEDFSKDESSDQQPCTSLNVYFVRHAESINNANKHHDESTGAASVQRSTEKDANSEETESPAKKRRSCKRRLPDPDISHKGYLQSRALAHFFSCLANDPKTHSSLRPRRLFTSGFRRSLQTCQALASELALEPELAANVFEEGGVINGERGLRPASPSDSRDRQPMAHGLNAPEMLEVLPCLKGADDVPNRGWWRGGQEAIEDTESRAQACAEWLWDMCRQRAMKGAFPPSPTCAATNGKATEAADVKDTGAIIVVTHGMFLDRWLKALLGMPPMADNASFLTANCAYWLLRLQLLSNGEAERRRTSLMACNVVEHVPMHIRTGHSLGSFYHVPPSYPNPRGASSQSVDNEGAESTS